MVIQGLKVTAFLIKCACKSKPNLKFFIFIDFEIKNLKIFKTQIFFHFFFLFWGFLLGANIEKYINYSLKYRFFFLKKKNVKAKLTVK